MEVESLVKLVASGNTRTVEEDWMRLVESPDTTLDQLMPCTEVLAELVRVGRQELAAALGWAALETLGERHAASDLLRVAGPILLAVGDAPELRGQVAQLYRTTNAGREGLDELLEAAGLEGGRPVRRALRTLDVCLTLNAGDFLLAREGDEAARVDRVDRSGWTYELTTSAGAERTAAVELADRFKPAAPDDFRVMRRFARETLLRRLADDPADVVVGLCRRHGNSRTRDELQAHLVPDLLTPEEWKSWWLKARAALKRLTNVQIGSRAPYVITVGEQAVTPEAQYLAGLEKLHDPIRMFEAVEAYARECKASGQAPSANALKKCYELIALRAKRRGAGGAGRVGPLCVLARYVGEMAGADGAADAAVALFAGTSDLQGVFEHLPHDALHELACRTLVEARPDSWTDLLMRLLPTFPLNACDREAQRLLAAGCGPEEFQPVVDRILASPVEHFEALAWLWNGPSAPPAALDTAPAGAASIPQPPPVSILSRILRALADCRRRDGIAKERVKSIAQRARTVLSARDYARYRLCLDGIDAGMAAALRTEIVRTDMLGRVVRDDLLTLLRAKFPILDAKPDTPPWARQDVLFVTRAGLAKKEQEIDHLVNVKMLENARAIGRAAEHGDLSENSEYKFALEERDLLRARLAQMNAEVAAAQVIDPLRVPTDHVGVGSKVRFRRVTDGDGWSLTLVGPWEAALDEGRMNYKAPMAQKVLGARVGDVIGFDHSGAEGQYEVVEISNGLIDSRDEA